MIDFLRGQGPGARLTRQLLAGVCVRHGLPLATRNRKHFDRVEGLQLFDVDVA